MSSAENLPRVLSVKLQERAGWEEVLEWIITSSSVLFQISAEQVGKNKLLEKFYWQGISNWEDYVNENCLFLF